MPTFTPYTEEEITREELAKKFTPYEGEEIETLDPYVNERPSTLDPRGLPSAAIGIGKGAINAIIETGKTAVALGEASEGALQNTGLAGNRMLPVNPITALPRLVRGIGSLLGSEEETATGMVENAVPAIPYEPGVEEVAGKASEIGTGIVAGSKGSGLVTKGLRESPGLLKKGIGQVTDMLGAEIGAVAMMDKNTDPTFLSKPTTEGDDPAVAKLKKAAVLAEDAMIAGALGGAIGKTISVSVPVVAGILRNIKDWRSMDAIQKEYVGIILDRMAKVSDDASPEEIQQAYKDVIDYMEKNSEITASFGKTGVEDQKFLDDTISTMKGRLNPKDAEDARIAVQLDGVRASALGGNNAPDLANTIARPDLVQNEALTQLDEVSGGRATSQNTQDAVISQGQGEIAETKIPTGMKQQEIDELGTQTNEVLRADPQLGPQIKAVEDQKNLNLDPNKPSLDAQTKVVEGVKDADLVAAKRTDEAYKKVADSGVPADMSTFNSILEKNRELINPTHAKALDKLLEENDGTFGYLYTQVRPRLEKMIQSTGDDRIAFDALKELKNDIDITQFDNLVNNVDEYGYSTQTARQAQEAKQAHINEQSVWGQGLARDMRENRIENPPFDPQHPNRPSREIDFKERGRSTLMSAIKDPNRRESVQQLRQAVGIKNSNLIDDVVVAEAAKDVVNQLSVKGGKFSPDDYDQLVKPLQDMIAGVSGKNKERLTKMFSQLKSGKLQGEALKKEMEELTKQAKLAEDKIYSDYLGDFITKQTGEKISNPDQIIKNIFNDPHAGPKLDKIIQAAKSDPVAMKGLEGAWGRRAKEILDHNTKGVAKFPQDLMDRGRQIFGEDGEVMVNALQKLNGKAIQNYQNTTVRMGGGFSRTENQTRATQSVNTILTWIFGVLNPRAAKIRTITSDLMKRNASGEVSSKAADVILSDPKEFIRIAKELRDGMNKRLTPEHKKILFRMVNNIGHYADGGVNPQLESQTQDAMPQ